MVDPVVPPPLQLIVAYARGRVIGDGSGMPWHYPADLRYFRRTTMHHALIMGRTTFQTIGRPLPGRTTIVLSRRSDYTPEGCQVAHDLAAAVRLAQAHDPAPFIAGGGQVYEQALPWCTRLYLTEIDAEHPGSVRFPALDPSCWRETHRLQEGVLTFRTLERVAPSPGGETP